MDVARLVRRAARLYPDREAVVAGGVRRTLAEVDVRSDRLANGLLALGLRRPDRAAVLLKNCAEYMEVDFGLAKAGLVRVSLNARLGTPDHRVTLGDAGVSAVIYGAQFGEIAETLRAEHPGIAHWIRLGGGAGPGLDYGAWLGDQRATAPPVANGPGDLYSLFYTSGTTGRPKGVMHTHGVIARVALNLLLDCLVIGPEDRVLLLQPLSHGSGFFMLPAFLRGACSVILDRFDPEEVVATARRERVSIIKLIPTMLIKLLDGSRATRGDLGGVRSIIYGASPMPVEKLKEAIDRFGPVFVQIYGQAEAPVTITVLPAEEHRPGGTEAEVRRLGSAGRPFLSVDARVLGADGSPVAPGEAGEVVVRSDHVMAGYWRRPDLTAEVLKDGAVYTRDMATVDEQGYIYLLGRRDEVINSGGFNIAPREVEEVLYGHAAVSEAAVIGIPDSTWGEAVHACVALKPGAVVSEAELLEFCKPVLGFRRPKGITFLPALPKNPYGKVLRQELRKRVGAEPVPGAGDVAGAPPPGSS
ncbi:MAG: AMP-binding protein [Candidatus Rokubacteria bacterium]|nr:AMP-binding protein [Candidatus Rokubacteria bacterium]